MSDQTNQVIVYAVRAAVAELGFDFVRRAFSAAPHLHNEAQKQAA